MAAIIYRKRQGRPGKARNSPVSKKPLLLKLDFVSFPYLCSPKLEITNGKPFSN
jgi:hypothetical protein